MVAELTLKIDAGPDAPGEARTALRRFHPELAPDLMQVVVLLASELVSNAVRHARAELVGVRFEVLPDRVRVEVGDRGPGFDPAHVPPSDGGWGLRLVDEMADRWGAADDHGFQVWFELDR